MKRGFLNTARSKRVIEEAYAPQPPPKRDTTRQATFSTPRGEQDGDEKAAAANDAMDVDVAKVEDESKAESRVIAVRTSQSIDGEAKTPSQMLDGKNTAEAKEKEFDGNDEETAVNANEDVGDTKAEPPSKDIKGKGKEEAVDADDHAMDIDGANTESSSTNSRKEDDYKARDPEYATPDAIYEGCFSTQIPPRPPPSRRGWGRDPKENFFHAVPESHGGRDKKRAVFLLWPRDPNGKPLMPSEKPRGTLSPDGYAWGATLYDLYHVQRLPKVVNMVTNMTGSAIREVMEELGELDFAKDEIEWGKSEGKPRVEGVADTEELIRCQDTRAQLGVYKKFSMARVASGEQMDERNSEQDKKDKSEDQAFEHDNETEEVDPASIPPPPTIPVTSPFHPSHYPEPWPLIPFKHPSPILLQERIPLHILPQTLYVHDPFGLLSAELEEREFPDTSWTSRPDVIRTYDLRLSSLVQSEVEDARRKAEELEEFKARTLIVLRYQRTKEDIQNHRPIIEIPLPPYQRRITKVEESHLYISPVARVGEGHHSVVYKGEWELPRSVFAKHHVCRLCFEEGVVKEVQRSKDTGRWKKMLKACSWGPNGFTGEQPSQADLDEVNDPPKLENDGEIIEREIICDIPRGVAPSQVFELINESNIWVALMERKETNKVYMQFSKAEEEPGEESHTPVIRINPPFDHENCTHRERSHPPSVPLTAVFTVVAKLSIEHDGHLAREARNYQQFPEHFFHHYNGYTIIPQLHAIVPVNAIVPQFYGYYTPQSVKDTRWKQPRYLSPILLLEHCGRQIVPEKLSVEDQEECASLLLRFQRAQWLHESVAPRNFLVQRGKPTEFPLTRQHDPETSFRLIDFGRSKKYETAKEKMQEEMDALRMFDKLATQMGVTLSL